MAASSALVGRTEEVRRLNEFLDVAISGQAQVAFLVGEPGIGKTRLAQELNGVAARRGVRVLQGRASQLERGLAYAPMLSALDVLARDRGLVDGLPQLARLFPGIGSHAAISADDPALERTVLYEAVVRLLERAADRAPVVLFIDDLHWADPASVELLHYLVRRLSSEPVLVLLALREAELGSDPALRELVSSLGRTGVAHEVRVGRLGDGEVEVMARRMLGAEPPATLLALLGDRAAGTPLAVEGLVESLVQSGQLIRSGGRWVLGTSEAPLPQSLRDLILDRLDRLDAAAREVADAVAVGADGLSHEILGAVVSLAGDDLVAAIRTAEAAGILAEEAPGGRLSYHLTHPLLQEVAYASLPEVARRRRHAVLAGALDRPGVGDLRSLARHYQRAGPEADEARALEVTLVAADHARSAYASSETASHLEAALALVRRGHQPSLLPVLLESLGEARSSLGQLEGAAEAWSEALAQRERGSDAGAVARLHRLLALCDHDRGRFEAAQAHLDAGIAALAREDLGAELAALLHARVVVLAPVADQTEVADAAAELLALGNRLGDPKVTAQAHLAQLVVDYADGKLGRAHDHGLAALDAARRTDDAWLLHRSLSELCFVGWSLGDLEGMRRHAEEALAVDRHIDAPALEAQIRRVFLVRDTLSGRLGQAVAEGNQAVELARRTALPRTLATNLAFRAWALVLMGDLDRSESDLAEADGVFATEPDNRMYVSLGIPLAQLALERNDVDGALAAAARFDPAARGVGGRRFIVRLPSGMALLADARLAAGDIAGVTALAEELARIGRAGSPLAAALAERTGGQALAVQGDVVGAVAALERARGSLLSMGLRWEAARTAYDIGRFAGNAESARAAMTGFDECGSARWAERTRSLLRTLGAPVPRKPILRPRRAGLSDRELDVARLVAEGMTNVEIARRLVVSPRTVTSHLDHIYARLGIGSRASLAAHLVSSGLLERTTDT